jgi:hypothetical protein
MMSPDWDAGIVRREFMMYRYTSSGKVRRFVQREGIWGELWKRHFLPVAGARAFTVDEYASDDLERLRSHGESFVRFDYSAVLSHGGLLDWCYEHAHDRLLNQVFLFRPRVWTQHSGEPLANPEIPFIPEIDEFDPALRRIAELESLRARQEAERDRLQRLRDTAIAEAASGEHTLRRIGAVAGLSFGRVRQIRDNVLRR